MTQFSPGTPRIELYQELVRVQTENARLRKALKDIASVTVGAVVKKNGVPSFARLGVSNETDDIVWAVISLETLETVSEVAGEGV